VVHNRFQHRKRVPQRLKPDPKQSLYRSAEALRHTKATAKASFSALCKAAFKNDAVTAAVKRYANQNPMRQSSLLTA
jgi:hypothetical protein